ncbi:MAG: TolC family protein [Bacteroidota bacterium]|nr:TolC family protein [Bacteroidota bacterium]
MKRKIVIYIFGLLLPAYSVAQNKDLAYFINTSVNNSPQLLEYRNLLLSNSIDSQLIIAANRYQITGSGNTYYAPVINGYGYDAAITNGQQLSALIALNKQIYNKRNLSLQFNSLHLQRDSLNITSRITVQDIKKTIITQYITTYGDQLQIDFNSEIIDLLTKEESILKKLTQKNVYRQVDYLSFLVTLQQQELTRSQLLVQYKNDYATLNYLAGIIDTAATTLAEPDLTVIKNYITDSSAFLLKYKVDSLRLINEKALIAVGYRPRVNLFADAGYQTTFYSAPYKNFGTTVGVNLTIPIYDGHQRQLQYTKINIRERTRQRQKEFFTTQYRQQIQQLEQQLSALERLAGPIDKQINYIQTLIEVNGRLLETGDIKITDYVLALNNYITSRNLVVQNRIARFQVINQLNYWNLKP